MWQCSKVKAFWEENEKTIEKIFSKDLVVNSVVFLLGLHPKNHKYTNSEQIMIYMSFAIALFWKKSSRPSVTHWVRQMLITFALEKITIIMYKEGSKNFLRFGAI